MNIIVLGGNGFIGSHFVKHAVRAGHRVSVVDLLTQPRHRHGLSFDFFRASTVELAANTELLRTADALVHLAYSTVPATANADPAADILDNLVPLVALLNGMKSARLNRMVYLSSGGAVYGPPKTVPIAEAHPLDPISAYGVSKVAAEKYLGLYAANWGLRPTIVRPANPYGVDQGKIGLLGAVTTFLNLLAADEPITIWGDGTIVRDFVHIDDVARLLLAAIEQDQPGAYNCGSGAGCSLLTLIETMEAVTKRKASISFQPARDFDPPEVILDIQAATRVFGWKPQVSLEDGVRGLADSLGLLS